MWKIIAWSMWKGNEMMNYDDEEYGLREIELGK